jgi:hypothetical protein
MTGMNILDEGRRTTTGNIAPSSGRAQIRGREGEKVRRPKVRGSEGNYAMLAQVFNLQGSDQKRLMNFLRKHDCHEPVRVFRTVPLQRSAA